jgi:para-nitrobenzyl esterase
VLHYCLCSAKNTACSLGAAAGDEELKKIGFLTKVLTGAALLAISAAGASVAEAESASGCAGSALGNCSRTVRLKVSGGAIKGLQEGGVRVYRGIPYAKPPVGDLRFAPPLDAEAWIGERDCTRFGSKCFQVSQFAGPEPQSEDCLTLNVWTPAGPGEDAGLPVYVFIHGGGFAAGSGSLPDYDGTGFAKKGIVAVTINYRLGALGFFASRKTLKQYGTTGNWGLLDQIKALQWVRDNIAAFGGDPGRVTIGGESAGSFSVSALMASPLSKGLFRAAIMESGSVLSLPSLSSYAKSDLRKSVEVSAMLARIFGAGDDAEGLAKMRGADAGALACFSAFVPDQTITPAFFLLPVFDGRVLPEDPLRALSSADFSGLDLLLGYNADEGSLFVPEGIDESAYKMLALRVFGTGKVHRVLERFEVDARHTALRRARQIVAYGAFSAGTKRFADIVADAGGDVYLYTFNYVSPLNRQNGLGAAHAAELPFVFNNLASGGLSGPEAGKLAAEMHTRWANFIKNGDPNVGEALPGGPQWPKYDTRKADALFLDGEITSGPLADRDNIDYMNDLAFGEN